MSIPGPKPQDVPWRLRRRLRQRYLRWLARQPIENVCLSEGCRTFWRSCRRRTNAFLGSRPVVILTYCLAIGALLFFLGAAVTLVVCAIRYLPELFFAPPEHQSFAGPAQRAAVALTRLTAFESATVPILFLWASRCFCSPSGLETRSFYEKYPPSRLAGYRIAFLCFLACSAAVAVGATIGHGATGYGVAASLTVTGCWGWLAWVAGKRLMAVRWPSRLSSANESAAAFAVLLLLMMLIVTLPAVRLLYGPAVLVVSEHLKWLGPFGWVNDLLQGLSLGQTHNLLPLAVCCAVAVCSGYWLDRPTAGWAFRRRLLSVYRNRETSRRATISTPAEPRVAHDLRQAIAGHDWKSWRFILWPRWVKGRATLLFLPCAVAFLLQLILARFVLLLETLEAESGQALDEKWMLCALVSSVAGWNVLLMEASAALFRDQAGLLGFARRPVSPGQLWKQHQLDGLSFAPTQVLFAVPFVALTAAVAPGYSMNSCLAVVVALLTCVAIRTVLSAGSCYFASIIYLRSWIAAVLTLLGTAGAVAEGLLIVGAAGISFATHASAGLTSGERALILLLQQIAALTALGIAWGVWRAVGRKSRGP